MKNVFILVMLLAFCSAESQAQWSNNAAVNNIICDLAGEQAIPKIATCPNGDTYIGYFSNETGNYNVRLQRLDAQGNELWATDGILISSNASDTWLTDWDMTADVNNHCVMTWQDIRNGNNNAYAYRIAPDGSFVWGANGVALSNNSEFNASPKVTCTAAGNAVFAWISGDNIIMQKINAAGVKQWGDNGITLSGTNTLNWPQLMPVGTDDIIMKYFEDSGPPNAPTRHVFAQRYSSTGSPVWASPAVISDAGGISAWTQIFPFINDGSDGFYIAWHDDRDNNQLASVWVQHITSSGGIAFAANGVEATSQGGMNHYYPYLAKPAGSDDVYVFWNEMNGLQSQKGIFGQKFTPAGTKQWGNNGMSFIAVSATQVTPWGAGGTDTDVMVMYDEATSGTSSTLKAMRIAPDGSFLWPGNSVFVSSVSSSKVHITMNDFQNNQWIVSWEDNRNASSDIYAQNLLLDGTLGYYDPQFGSIQGQVTLDGGTGNITQVQVSAGNETTFPDPTGFYTLTVPVGTYTVTANLAGYYPGSVSGVVVLEDQATTGVDFILEAIPTTGYITGHVVLTSGSGDVTATIVTAGTHSTSPDASGFYTLETEVGVWDVEASLAGYTPQIRSGINVTPGGTTPNVDFSLSPLPTTGYVQGTVHLTGGTADVTQATVTAGSASAHPGANGFYFLELPVGQHDITASHPYTDSQTIEGVVVEPGLSTTGVDFTLQVNRTDLVCKAVDQYGGTLYDAEVTITGPEDTYNGTILTDSLVFENVPYGFYAGSATLYGSLPVTSDTLIDASNHTLVFTFIVGSVPVPESAAAVKIIPNPANEDAKLEITISSTSLISFEISDAEGKKITGFSAGQLDAGTYGWPLLTILNGKFPQPGVYFLNTYFQGKMKVTKFIIR